MMVIKKKKLISLINFLIFLHTFQFSSSLYDLLLQSYISLNHRHFLIVIDIYLCSLLYVPVEYLFWILRPSVAVRISKQQYLAEDSSA